MGGPHAYELISLSTAGIIVGLWLVLSHLWMAMKSEDAAALLRSLPRNYSAGVVITSISMAWFWLLVAPKGLGVLSSLEMDLGEFDGIKPILRLAIPVTLYLFVTQVREFLFVRGLGLFVLMLAAPILEAAFLKEPSSRLLLPIFAFILVLKGLFWVGMPYTFRDAVGWATSKMSRFKLMSYAGVVYGIVVLACAFTVWKGH